MGAHNVSQDQSKNTRRSEVSKRSRRSSNQTNESSLILSADSLDLIYIDDYFDDERYLKLVAKRLAEKRKAKMRAQAASKKPRSLSSLPRKSIPKTRHEASKSAPHILKPSQSKSKPTSKSRPVASTPVKSVKISTPPSTKNVPTSSRSTGNLPSRSNTTNKGKPNSSDKLSRNISWHSGVATTPQNRDTQRSQSPASSSSRPQSRQVSNTSSPGMMRSDQTFIKPRSILTTSTTSQTKSSDSARVRSQRSFVRSSNTPRRSSSLSSGWRPTSSPAVDSASKPEHEAVQNEQVPNAAIVPTRPSVVEEPNTGTGDQNSTKDSSSSEERPAKKKLVVRGLRNFVNSRRRDSSSLSTSSDSFYSRNYEGRGDTAVSFPASWKREFPSKSKFHPDNYIYDWPEGPNAPTRPFSAMAKCKKHGGRCNDCGLFTCDLCQSCKKCENDCACPVGRGNAAYSNPYSQAGAYEEVFGGDGWAKARKVLCDLTEDDKRHPVGGNSSKKAQQLDENWAKHNFYKSQINVLNPYNMCSNEVLSQGMAPTQPPPVPFQYPMCPPPMYPPMPFMPMMVMPPPMMPFYPPPPPPCYDPCCAMPPPPCPYPSNDCFMPNY